MKIVHIAYVFVDGLNYQENELPKAHAAAGNDVTVITTINHTKAINIHHRCNIDLKDNPYYLDKVKVIRLKLMYKVDYRFSILKDLYIILEKEKPDIIYYHGGAYLNLLIVKKYKQNNPNCYVCMDFHGEYYNSATNPISKFYHKYFFRLIIQKAIKNFNVAYYITPLVGEFTKEMYKLPSDKLKMLPLGVNLSKIDFENKVQISKDIRDNLNIGLNDLVVISGGRIEPEKNTINLVKAIREIENINIHLIIFGDIIESYKEDLDRTINNNPNIHLIGWVSPNDINNYYLSSDIACFPGGQSVLWQQAIGAGLPICVKYFKGLEYLDHGGNVRFLYKDDSNAIKSTLNELINNQELIKSMAKIAQEKARDYFSYEKIAQTVIDDMKHFKNNI